MKNVKNKLLRHRLFVISVVLSTSLMFGPTQTASAGAADDTLWILGGQIGAGNYSNDVWCSTDQGENWTEVTSAAPWSERMNHKVKVFENQLWLIGGNTATGNVGDVWRTTGVAACAANGLTWEEVTSAGPWGTRAAGAMIVYDNKLWYMGGACFWCNGC